MTFKELKNKIKEEQKTLAQSIRNGKSGRKPVNRNKDNRQDFDNIIWNKYNYRHRHIAYCQFFNNTSYEKIENPREENRPRSQKIDGLKDTWAGQLDEALRDCA